MQFRGYNLSPWKRETFENLVRKGENPGYQHILLFPQCFLPYQRLNSLIVAFYDFPSEKAFGLDCSKILLFHEE